MEKIGPVSVRRTVVEPEVASTGHGHSHSYGPVRLRITRYSSPPEEVVTLVPALPLLPLLLMLLIGAGGVEEYATEHRIGPAAEIVPASAPDGSGDELSGA